MPLNYLNSGPEDVYALNRLGSTFSDMVIGLQQNRQRQQQFMAQQALAQAQLQLEREREQSNELTARETRKKIGAETEKFTTDVQDTRQQMQAGGMLGDVMKGLGETDASRNPDIAQMLRAIAMQQGGRIAATHPANIGQQIPQLMAIPDPVIRNLIATGSPSTANVAPGATLYDVGGRQPLFSSPPRVNLQDPRLLNARIAHEYATGAGALQRANYGQATPESSIFLNQAIQAAQQGQPTGSTSSTSSTSDISLFDSEDAARAAGHRTGSRVRLKGIGLVELQ